MYGIKGCPEGDGGQRSQTGSQWGTYIGYDGAQPPHLLVLGGYIHACASATISRKKYFSLRPLLGGGHSFFLRFSRGGR